jgi:hypothetical protein
MHLMIVMFVAYSLGDASTIMHSACEIGNARIGPCSGRAVQIRTCRGQDDGPLLRQMAVAIRAP